MFNVKKEIKKRQNSDGTICNGSIRHFFIVKRCKGSFSLEAALIFPLIMFCFCVAIQAGISLQTELRNQSAEAERKESLDIIECLYRKEYAKKVIGEIYED